MMKDIFSNRLKIKDAFLTECKVKEDYALSTERCIPNGMLLGKQSCISIERGISNVIIQAGKDTNPHPVRDASLGRQNKREKNWLN